MQNDERRYHAFDQLRAVVMWLVIVFHSSFSFAAHSLGKAWPYRDANTSAFFDILLVFITLFQMPLFFIMSGFFTAYLYYRRGAGEMLKNRLLRVAVPFALFLTLLFPVVTAGFLFCLNGGVHGGWEAARAYLADPLGWYANLQTMHLWFLYYLILYSLAIGIVAPLFEKVIGTRARALATRLGTIVLHPLGVSVGIATTFLTLLPMRRALIYPDTGFLVQPKILLANGVFVGFGWVLYLNRDQLHRFTEKTWMFILAGFLLSCAHIANTIVANGRFLIAAKVLVATAIWTLIYGFIGLFLRYLDHPKPLGRYLADASYWMYLVHIPFTIWVPGLMAGWNAPAVVKMAITLAATAGGTLVTYHYFVRSTAIGALLNGRRYPRGLPAVSE